MKKIKALLITSMFPLFGLWGFNIVGFLYGKTGISWGVWIYINLLLAAAYIGCMVGAYLIAKGSKSDDAKVRKTLKNMVALSIASFVIVSAAHALDIGIMFSGTKNETATIVMTSINLVLFSLLIGFSIYGLVKTFEKRARPTTHKTTTTTVKK